MFFFFIRAVVLYKIDKSYCTLMLKVYDDELFVTIVVLGRICIQGCNNRTNYSVFEYVVKLTVVTQ